MASDEGEASLSPEKVAHWLTKLGEDFVFGAQEDAHEFLRAMMRMLTHEEVRATAIPV
jgi:ubiquitin C-terminal hydrolase